MVIYKYLFLLYLFLNIFFLPTGYCYHEENRVFQKNIDLEHSSAGDMLAEALERSYKLGEFLKISKWLEKNDLHSIKFTASGNTVDLLHLAFGMTLVYAPNEQQKTNFYNLVFLLLKSGANPNAIHAVDGVSPLHEAADYGDPKLVQLLLDFGADPFQVDKKSQLPIHLAAFHIFKKVGDKYAFNMSESIISDSDFKSEIFGRNFLYPEDRVRVLQIFLKKLKDEQVGFTNDHEEMLHNMFDSAKSSVNSIVKSEVSLVASVSDVDASFLMNFKEKIISHIDELIRKVKEDVFGV